MADFLKHKPPTGRNSSFEKTLELLYETFGSTPINIVETGTIRENSEEKRYGDGWGTLNWQHYSINTNSKVWSVDNNTVSIDAAKSVVPETENIKYILSDSIEFLHNFKEKIDLLFLDSYDYCGDEDNINYCLNHTLNEAIVALPKLSENAFVLVDDVFDVSFGGKGKLVVPYLLDNGFELVHCYDSQALLKRKKSVESLPKVSCVMTTYGRFHCVQNSIKFFLKQDYKGEKELIIYNTDVNFPLSLGETLISFQDQIKIINCNIDHFTKKPYNNVGSIRRDALTFAANELYICWDDDDIFLPYNISQCVEGITKSKTLAWKPKYSMFWGGGEPEYAENVMEASVIVYTNELLNRGFRQETGSEHCGWYQQIVDEGQFFVDDTAIPAYCFNWSRSTGHSEHKQSGDINNPDNFNNHKAYSTDHALKPLELINDQTINLFYDRFYKMMRKVISNFPSQKSSFEKYIPRELIFVSAQPDDIYFTWQIEVQIHNFRKYNYADKMHVLIWYRNENIRDEWKKLQTTYTDVNFFFYKDEKADVGGYLPVLRPHILKKHFKAYPELKDKSIFYHDSDIIFTNYIDFNPMNVGDAWYLSDTISYIGGNYIKQKGEYILDGMCNIVGIDKKVVEDNEKNAGGAQCLGKNMTYEFWGKVEKDCVDLYKYMNQCNNDDLFKRIPKVDIQSWCADMWALLWNAFLLGKPVLVVPVLTFSWATGHKDEYDRCNIFHNAGATGDRKDLFFKGAYMDRLPYNEDFSEISPNFGSYYYVELIKEMAKTSCLL